MIPAILRNAENNGFPAYINLICFFLSGRAPWGKHTNEKELWSDGSLDERWCLSLSSCLTNRIPTQFPDYLGNPQEAVECQHTSPYSLVVSSLRQVPWIVQQMIINFGILLISKGSLGNSWEIAPWPHRELQDLCRPANLRFALAISFFRTTYSSYNGLSCLPTSDLQPSQAQSLSL